MCAADGTGVESVTVMVLVTGTLDPAELLAISVTAYVPAAVYVADAFLAADVVPLPKPHAQVVGTPEEVSANETVSGEVPETVEAVKLPTGTVVIGDAVTEKARFPEVLELNSAA